MWSTPKVLWNFEKSLNMPKLGRKWRKKPLYSTCLNSFDPFFSDFHFFPRSLELYDRKQCFRGHLWRKNKSFHKKPTFLSCPKKPNWVPLNGAVGWDLRAQWDILSKYYDILTKYLTVLSTLSRQHHSAGLNLAFFDNLKHRLFLKRFVFPPQMSSEALFSVI